MTYDQWKDQAEDGPTCAKCGEYLRHDWYSHTLFCAYCEAEDESHQRMIDAGPQPTNEGE